MHSMDRTTLGTISKDTRKRVAEYRDQNEFNNYDEALNALLDESA